MADKTQSRPPGKMNEKLFSSCATLFRMHRATTTPPALRLLRTHIGDSELVTPFTTELHQVLRRRTPCSPRRREQTSHHNRVFYLDCSAFLEDEVRHVPTFDLSRPKPGSRERIPLSAPHRNHEARVQLVPPKPQTKNHDNKERHSITQLPHDLPFDTY